MAPKAPEKQHSQQQQQQQQQHHTHLLNSPIVKHSSPFYISAHTLCHNKRLKLKRSKYAEQLQKLFSNRPSTSQLLKTEAARRQQLSLLQADVTIDLLSDDEDRCRQRQMHNNSKQSVIVYPERMCLERAAILGLMPVERSTEPPPLVPLYNNIKIQQIPIPTQITIQPQFQQQQLQQQQQQQQQPTPIQLQPRKRKSRPQKRRSLPTASLATPQMQPPILLNSESIVLSDDEPEISVTYPISHQIPCLPPQNTMQVDEEVTISLVPRSLTATTCASRSASSSINTAAIQNATFPMLPDETTVHTVIANRIYELSLTKLREGLASCGIPEFASDGQQKISPQRRKGTVHKPPVVSPPQAPISLKLSSDLSISLISDDEDESRRQRLSKHEALLSPAFLQKLPVNVSIAPVPIMRPQTQNHTTELRKLKLG